MLDEPFKIIPHMSLGMAKFQKAAVKFVGKERVRGERSSSKFSWNWKEGV